MPVLKRDDTNSPTNIHDVHTILGPESTFEGKLVFEGTVRIDGKFKGEIKTNDILVVGQGARVEANVTAGRLIINGELVGNAVATDYAEIKAPGILKGNISTPQLTIEKGVIFDGNCHMSTDTTNKAATPLDSDKTTCRPTLANAG